MASKPDIRNLDQRQLIKFFENSGMRGYRADQTLRWLYFRRADNFDQMTDLAKDARTLLSTSFYIGKPAVRDKQTSEDGTCKFLFALEDGNAVESVLIPEKDHYTLCISTQVGCAMGCTFCMTAKTGLTRNLSRAEIIGQVIAAMDAAESRGGMRLSNIVLMGMGEPLANYKNVISAIDAITDSNWGLKFSTRRVTLSTAGLADRFDDLARDARIRLAVSLNAADNETRNRLMPVNKAFPLDRLIKACANYPLPARDKITFEYILIKGINDSEKDALQLAKLLRPVRAKINLIPLNQHPGSGFVRPEIKEIESFQSILTEKNYTAIIRRSKGADISAACGQLRGETKTLSHS
ncbi:MAG: 23S rRNA (adenine(2503)-C(2))-methyltransferase RlmN [Desulfobacteraceae bacterium]|nr:23S rRNA (adenine(2503)-C(2))-methyltransferase RlmN [Desulfobacteraceae bacterium]MCF8095793.1 23S rRNA (adenine(2503)-C(2))-methyltransferase RlmN [Desulfobacteraceae bacterium]